MNLLLSKSLLSRLQRKLEDELNLALDDSPDSIGDLRLLFKKAIGNDPETVSRIDQILVSVTGSRWLDEIPANYRANKAFLAQYPISLSRSASVIAFDSVDANENRVMVAIACDEGWQQLDNLRRLLGAPIEPFFTTKSTIEQAINTAFQNRSSQTETAIETLVADPDVLRIEHEDRQDLLDQKGRPPVIRLVNSILFDAVQDRASDIHIQPYEDKLQVRFRIDGVLFDQFEIPKPSQEEILSRVKIIGKMNIAEKRLPQDGRATAEIGDRKIDLRIASLPTSYGERIVIRLLDKSARLYTLDQLGMAPSDLARFQQLIRLEHGLILVTGPTGGGKSTTLYAALQEINTNEANVVTLEDPIEYQLQGISQTQINEKKGMTFASGLRNVLRQDPDIIMIGEIRDQETAEMAIQSALTGHMVFSTLHTNDAPTAVTRLLDLGIEPFLVGSSVVGVLSQRLVRKICEHCRALSTNESDLNFMRKHAGNDDNWSVSVGLGCDRCRGTGFRGRVGVFEMMVASENLKAMIQSRANAGKIRAAAQQEGMRLLTQDGVAKVLQGLTTVSEIVRISMQLDPQV